MDTQTITLSWTSQQRQNERRRTIPKIKKARAEYYRSWYLLNGRNRTARDKELGKLWALQNPKAVGCRQKVFLALKAGTLVKPSRCSNCGEKRAILAHHEDYDQPLQVIWLCFSCHPRDRN